MRTIFEWTDFREVAEDLSKNPKEQYIRSSIDRHYYSLFGSSREYLIKLRRKYHLMNGRSNIHQKVKNELINSKNDNEKEIGEILDNLRKIRNQASYEKEKFDRNYFEEHLTIIEKDMEIAFESLNYLKRNPPINR